MELCTLFLSPASNMYRLYEEIIKYSTNSGCRAAPRCVDGPGKLKYRVYVVEGLKNALAAMNKLFGGLNAGRLIIKVT
jgi:NADPH-dependent curcumin reductase CurA